MLRGTSHARRSVRPQRCLPAVDLVFPRGVPVLRFVLHSSPPRSPSAVRHSFAALPSDARPPSPAPSHHSVRRRQHRNAAPLVTPLHNVRRIGPLRSPIQRTLFAPCTPVPLPDAERPSGMLPHVAPSRSNCSVLHYAPNAALRTAAPFTLPRSSARRRSHGHCYAVTVRQDGRSPTPRPRRPDRGPATVRPGPHRLAQAACPEPCSALVHGPPETPRGFPRRAPKGCRPPAAWPARPGG